MGDVNEQTHAAIKRAIERDADNRIADLHVWHVSPRHYSASLSVVTHEPKAPEYYKCLLRDVPDLEHILVEVNECHGEVCA
jgi:Co/Zn/Cd efflux system component